MGDALALTALLGQILHDQEIANVTCDVAFHTRKSNDAITARGAAAITLIPDNSFK